ncbi:aldehyde dehydrogenase family protein [Streptomyces sp. NP160]|nr:aldehyde dehydrogenase family protein [Streptomyces sp. NP160]
MAGGNAVILKPSQHTPLAAELLVDLLREAGLPEQVVTVIHGGPEVTQVLVQAREVRMVSFTGGFATARAIAATAGIKRLAMELGGNAPVIVFPDADLELAVRACASGAFWAAGQNCIGAQRLLVHRDVAKDFTDQLVAATAALVVGDPRQEATDVGPMISADAASAAAAVIQEAVSGGARLLTGGGRRGSQLTPAVLSEVPRSCGLWQQEVFAPVVVIETFEQEQEAVAAANDCEYALQAGVFTRDLTTALRVAEAVEAGGVMINDSSDFRLDAMPFGGSKYGSMGRESVRFAFEEMTQPKVVAIAL